MGDRYHSAESPRGISDERFSKLAQETSKGISSFNQLTRSMAQKMSLFSTPQDSRANHQQLTELSEKGNKMVSKINKRLQELNKASQGQGPQARARRTQVTKLSTDFKNQAKQFEDTCKRLVDAERHAVDHIRRSSQSFRKEDSFQDRDTRSGKPAGGGFQFTNYNEDQLYAQANVTRYDEDDLARREEDIIHINHQMREVNAAFREIDGLIQEQGETVVEIDQNVEEAKDNVHKALQEVEQADARARYCVCSRMKMMCYGGLVVVLILIVLALVRVAA
ncbi:hypothetical protein ATCC90586_003262 [Pythium insidiosum]|nr:hypothetical protein ATCC90586_003262 [Pythium insidiosum]